VDWVRHLLESTPPLGIYLIVGLIIGLESMGIPLPGEVTLVTASLLAVKEIGSPWGVAIAAAIGAIVGDSLGYAFGRRGGRPLLERLGRRFPKHLGPTQVAKAESMFHRYGTWAVFFGRFIALLRILAGPMAGALHVPYRKFLLANASGGIVWSFGTVFVIYAVGEAAEKWLARFSWLALALAVLAGIATSLWLKNRAKKADVTAKKADV
jgi:membrane protein DedA with SNARE-associated domain